MARFNIEVRTETRVAETVVVESGDLTALRIEIAKFVGQLLTDHAAQIWVDEDWQVEATDDRGLILFVLNIMTRNTAASMPPERPGI